MKNITNKQYQEFKQYQEDKLHGRILTPDGLKMICAANDYDPEKIGQHFLDMLAKLRREP